MANDTRSESQYIRRVKKNRICNSRKLARAVGGIYATYASDVKNIEVNDCRYTGEGRYVCPFCGGIDKRTVDYNVTKGAEEVFGSLWGIAVCAHCNTLYKYYFN